MMWPRRPTTWTRSSPWANSKTGVPSTYDRFDFPPLRIVAIRIEALNFSVTMSRRTERFARKGLYLTVCRWMFWPMIPRARVSSSVRAPRASRARCSEESTSNRFGRPSRIRGFHDCGDDRHTRDAVPREEGCVLRGHPADGEHGQGRTVDDRVEDLDGQHGLLGLCRAREERSHRNVVGVGFRGRRLLARFSVDRNADDRLWSEHRPRDSRGWIIPSKMDAVRVHPAGELGIVVHEKGDSKSAREVAQRPTGFDPLLRGVEALVPELNRGDTTLESRGDDRPQVRHRFLRCRNEVDAAEATCPRRGWTQEISPARARLNATQNGSRSAGLRGRPWSRQVWPFFVKWPMSSACISSLFKRAMTSDTASGSTAITRVPSLIASNGSMPKTFETAATAGSTGTLARFTSTPSPEACAISQTAFRTPPSVASCIAQTPPLRKPMEAAANASSTVLIESNRARARFVTSAPSLRSISSGNVFERMAVASRAAVLVTRT